MSLARVACYIRVCGLTWARSSRALAQWNEQYEARKLDLSLPAPTQYALRRELNSIKRAQFPWMLESTKCAPQEAIIALGAAFTNFFAGRAKHPTFKKKNVSAESFRLSSGQFRIEGKRLRVPNIGWVRMREAVRFEDATQVSVTISKQAGQWYASVHCELTHPIAAPTIPASTVGVDLGVREYVVSDGTRHRVPGALRNAQRRLKRAQQSLARTVKGSKNRAKARHKVAMVHHRVANTRTDWMHKLTTGLANSHDRIVIEDLNVRGMLKNHRLALSIADASFGEFRRQLEYKTTDRSTTLIVADRWFPSSKTCSACGAKTTRTLALQVRLWTCETCETAHDRDVNAAINLALYAGSSPVSACGELFASAGTGPDGLVLVSGLDEAGTRWHQAI